MTDVEVRLTADLDGATKEVSGFRKEYAQLVKEIEKPLRHVSAYRDLENTLDATSRSVRSAKDRVRELGNELARTENPTKELTASYQLAAQELKKLERQELSQTASLRRQQAELKRTGVDTSNLAAEQRRLSAELNKQLSAGRADAAMSSARGSLGVGEISRAQQALVALRAQYRLVAADGSLSSKERAEAESAYRLRVNQSLEALRKLRAAAAAPIKKVDIQQASSSAAAAADQRRYEAAAVGIRAQAAALGQVTREQRLANIEEARSGLGVSRYRELNAELARLRSQYALVRSAGGLTTRELAIAQQTLNQRIEETQNALRGISSGQGRGLGATASSIVGLAGNVGGAYAAIEAVRAFSNITDSAKSMQAQLKLATNSQAEFNKAQADTYDIAQNNRAPLEDVVRLYARLSPALTDIGYSQRDVAGVTDALAKALKISGATTEETASTLTQFSQALGSGVLRGEEFNSVAESAPRLLRAFADGLGVPVGALRDMAAEGKLTADVIADLTLGALPQLTVEAAELPDTVGGAMTRLKNSVVQFAAAADESIGFTQALIDRIDMLTKSAQLADGAISSIRKGGLKGAEGFFSGVVDEANIAAVDTIVEKLKAARKELQENGSLGNINRFIYGDATIEDFDKAIAGWEAQGKRLQDIGKSEATAAEINAAAVLGARRKQVSALKALGAEQLKDVTDALKAQAAGEKKALAESQRVKDARIGIEAKYAETIATLNNGGAATASYSNAQSLKLSAQDSLRRGDIEGAKKQAEAARQMLLDIQSAGGNTYGLSGFAKGLEQIELEANKLEQSDADQKILTIATNIAVLKSKADELKDIKVTPTMDDAAMADLIAKMQSLAADLGKTLVIPAMIVPTLAPQSELNAIALQPDTPLSYPGFADGGRIAGPGTGSSDSILARLSNGEFVVTAAATRHYGPEVLEQLNARRLPKFADGGVVGSRVPSIPAMSPLLAQPATPQFPHLGRYDFGIGDRTYEMYTTPSVADELRAHALKRGRPLPRG